MSALTAGPWLVVKHSKPQVSGDYFVARKLLVDDGSSHYEQLRDEDGFVIRFSTGSDALAAIAKVAGEAS